MGFNEEAKHGLIMNKRLKTTFGLGKAHCAKNVLRREREEKARVFQEEAILVGDHPHFWFLSDQASWVKKIQRDLS